MDWTIIGLIAAFYALYIHYLAYLSLYRAKKSGNLSDAGKLAKALGYVAYLVGFLLDIAFNIVVFSIVFVEPPTTFTITQRCQKHLRKPHADWRTTVAEFICNKMLDPFQEGGHC